MGGRRQDDAAGAVVGCVMGEVTRDVATRPARDSAAESGEDPARWATGRLLSTAARLVENRWNEGLARFGLTHAGFGVIAHLLAGPLSQHEIAGLTKVEDQTMSRTLDRLERQGHIAREQDSADRRRRIVTVTGTGRDAFAAVARSQMDLEIVDERIAERCDLEQFRAALLALLEPEEQP